MTKKYNTRSFVARQASVVEKQRSRSYQTTLAVSLALEPLENRLLLTTENWIGGTGNWNNAAMWSGGAVPTYGDTVNINVPESVVSVTDTERSDNITAAAGTTLNINAGAYLYLDNGGTIDGSLTVNAAQGQTAAGQIGAGNSVPLTLSGTTNMDGLFYQGAIANTGTLNLNGAAFNSSGTLTNNATANISNGFNFGSNFDLVNTSTGTVNLQDDAGLSGSGTLNNAGTLSLTSASGGGTAVLSGIQLQDSAGTISVQSGTLADEQSAYFASAKFNIASGAAFALDSISPTNNGDTFFFSGTSTGSGAGHLLFNGGEVIPGGPTVVAATAVLNFSSGLAQVTGSYFASNPQDGPVSEITNSGFLNYTGTAQHVDMGFSNQGTVTVTGTGNLDVDSNGAFDNTASGILDFETDAGITNTGGNTAFTNEGLIEKTGGTGVSVVGITGVGFGDINFSNDGGGFNVQTGTISLQNSGDTFAYAAGPITVAAGATLNIDAFIVTTGTFSSTGGGQVTFTGGNWAGPSSGENPGILDFTPGAFTVSGGVFVNSQSGGVPTNDGTIQYTGANTIQDLNNAGTLLFTDAGPVTFETGTVTNQATGVFDFATDTTIDESENIALNNSGTIEKTGGSGELDFNPLAGALTNSGVIRVEDGSINLPYTRSLFAYFGDTVLAGSTYEADGGSAITIAGPYTPLTTIDGTVILNGVGSTFAGISGVTTNNGTLELLNGASFTTAGGLTNTGTLSVGGNLTVEGNLVESGSPTLNFAVSGLPNATGAPLLSVTGTTTLAGVLTAEYTGGIGSNGNAYTVANFASASAGGFASTSGVGPAFTVALHPTSIVLNGANHPAITAKTDTYSVQGNSFITIAANQGVLANDTDPNGRSLTAVQLTNPSHGLLVFNADGSFTYQPFNDFKGVDSFTYYATDSAVTSTPTTVTLNVGLSQPAFSNLTSPSIIPYGTAIATFAGVIGAVGAYPPVGENVTVTLNGLSQLATIGANGAFSTTFNTSTLPASLTSYTVSYSYAGDNSFLSASDTATTTVTVNKANASILLGNLNQSYSGSAEFASATTSPVVGLPVNITYSQNGNAVASPTAAGSYAVTATIVSANYQGTQTGNLVITNTGASLLFGGSSTATYDGNAHAVTVSTTPLGLSGASIAYSQNGNAVASPTNAGTYNVVATLNNPNYSATPINEILTIAPAATAFSGLTTPFVFTGPTPTVLGQPSPPYTGPVLETLGGVISGNGVFPPAGETVAITLDGVTQNATIGANGAFSSVFSLPALTESAAPYPVTYAYVSDGNFQSISNSSATTVTDLPPVVAGVAPVVTLNPLSQNVSGSIGGIYTFTASATGTPTPTEQWQVSTDGAKTFNNIVTSSTYAVINNELELITSNPAAFNGDEYRAVFTNASGTATTTAATLTVGTVAPVGTAPVVTTNPASQSVAVGQPVIFTAAATGVPNPTVQWQYNPYAGIAFGWTNIAGATSTTYSIAATPPNGFFGPTEYRAVFTNSYGTATTTAATLNASTANPGTNAPYITLDPSSQSVGAGSMVTLTAAATGTPTPTVQWQVAPNAVDAGFGLFTNVAGATSATYSFTAASTGNGAAYRAVFTNATGKATTTNATITVGTAPVVTVNPINSTFATSFFNSTPHVTLNATATGTPLPTVQWLGSPTGAPGSFVDLPASDVTTNPYGFVTNNTQSTLTLPQSSGDLYVEAVFTNASGSTTTSVAALTVPAAAVAPVVTTNPMNQTFVAGTPITLTAAATGTPTPTVRWQVMRQPINGPVFGFTNIPGATSPTYTFTPTGLDNGAEYQAVFTNSAGAATTAAATLTITGTPVVTANPTSQGIAVGKTVTLTAAATGSPTPTVQWQYASALAAEFGIFTNIPGATSPTYSFTANTSQSGYEYRAVFTNAAGSATTTTATVTVGTVPVVTVQPVSVVLNPGATVTASATGTPLPTVQWQASTSGAANSFVNLPAADYTSVPNSLFNATTTVTTLTVPQGLGYRYVQAVFTNAVGTVTTSIATLVAPAAPAAPLITTNPVSKSVAAGATFTLTAAASGTPAPLVQWYAISTTPGFPPLILANDNSPTLTLSATVAMTGFQYYAVFSNASGTATTTSATITVIPGALPVVTTNPVNQSPSVGSTATFTAAANGATGVQWQVSTDNGATFTPINGETSTTLRITAQASAVGDQYRAVFTNASGSINTAAATLNVHSAPVILSSPLLGFANGGQSTTITATARGGTGTSVQWYRSTNGGATFQPISGATSTAYTFTPTAASVGWQFRAVFTNAYGSTTTSAAPIVAVIITQLTTRNGVAGVLATIVGATSAPQISWGLGTAANPNYFSSTFPTSAYTTSVSGNTLTSFIALSQIPAGDTLLIVGTEGNQQTEEPVTT